MKKNLTLAITICFLFASAPANAQCEDVSVPGIHVNPFNMNELILHSFNENESEIFDYPGWRLYNESGVLIAEEQVQFFGIFGRFLFCTWGALSALFLSADPETEPAANETLAAAALEGFAPTDFALAGTVFQPSGGTSTIFPVL